MTIDHFSPNLFFILRGDEAFASRSDMLAVSHPAVALATAGNSLVTIRCLSFDERAFVTKRGGDSRPALSFICDEDVDVFTIPGDVTYEGRFVLAQTALFF